MAKPAQKETKDTVGIVAALPASFTGCWQPQQDSPGTWLEEVRACMSGKAMRVAGVAARYSNPTTFKEQSERWIDELARSRRKPVKPATISGWQDALDAWLLPNIGSKLLSDVSNGTLRELVGRMIAAELSAKTICNYVQVVKLVVASAVDENTGEQTYPRKWNHDFIGLPLIDRTKQHRPTVTETEMPEILASAKDRLKMLFALLAGTGLRIGEALAIHVGEPPSDDYSYITNDCRMV